MTGQLTPVQSGSWQVHVRWREVVPAYFESLARAASEEGFDRRVDHRLRAFGEDVDVSRLKPRGLARTVCPGCAMSDDGALSGETWAGRTAGSAGTSSQARTGSLRWPDGRRRPWCWGGESRGSEPNATGGFPMAPGRGCRLGRCCGTHAHPSRSIRKPDEDQPLRAEQLGRQTERDRSCARQRVGALRRDEDDGLRRLELESHRL